MVRPERSKLRQWRGTNVDTGRRQLVAGGDRRASRAFGVTRQRYMSPTRPGWPTRPPTQARAFGGSGSPRATIPRRRPPNNRGGKPGAEPTLTSSRQRAGTFSVGCGPNRPFGLRMARLRGLGQPESGREEESGFSRLVPVAVRSRAQRAACEPPGSVRRRHGSPSGPDTAGPGTIVRADSRARRLQRPGWAPNAT